MKIFIKYEIAMIAFVIFFNTLKSDIFHKQAHLLFSGSLNAFTISPCFFEMAAKS